MTSRGYFKKGFAMAVGGHTFGGLTLRGVFVSYVPVGENERAFEEDVLEIEVPAASPLDDYSIGEEGQAT